MNRPPSGSMVYWRFKAKAPCPYRFGYVTYTNDQSMVQMGNWNGDTMGGSIVDSNEIEWKEYHR